MKSRLLRPDFFSDDKLAECGPFGLHLYLGLMCLADRDGRLEDRPTKIKVQILPYFDANIDEILDALASAKLIVRYEVAGTKLIEVVDFNKHQQVYAKEKSEGYPAPSKASSKPSASLGEASEKLINNNNNNNNINNNTTKERSSTTKAPKPDKITEIQLHEQVDTPEVRQALELWLAYKKEKNQSYKPTGLQMLYRKISEMGGPKFILAVENSIQSNYSGLFAPSETGRGSKETSAEKSQRILRENHERFRKMREARDAGETVQPKLLFGGFL